MKKTVSQDGIRTHLGIYCDDTTLDCVVIFKSRKCPVQTAIYVGEVLVNQFETTARTKVYMSVSLGEMMS